MKRYHSGLLIDWIRGRIAPLTAIATLIEAVSVICKGDVGKALLVIKSVTVKWT